ncbi:hypothetical protein [Fournierella sp.]
MNIPAAAFLRSFEEASSGRKQKIAENKGSTASFRVVERAGKFFAQKMG